MNLNQEISRMVTRFHAVHRSVLLLYLSRYYNMSTERAESALHKAEVAHYCYIQDDFVCESDTTKIDSYTECSVLAVR